MSVCAVLSDGGSGDRCHRCWVVEGGNFRLKVTLYD